MVDAAQIEAMTSDEIKELMKIGESVLKKRDDTTRKQLWDEIKFKVEGAGHSVEELLGWGMSLAKATTTKSPVKIKYQGPNGETWTGRGKPPNWLTTMENGGHSRSEFLIDKPVAAEPLGAEMPEERTEPEEHPGASEPAHEEDGDHEASEEVKTKPRGRRKTN